jgi:hypothetical protein
MTREKAVDVVEKGDRLLAQSEKTAKQIAGELGEWLEEGETTVKRRDNGLGGFEWLVGVSKGSKLKPKTRGTEA